MKDQIPKVKVNKINYSTLLRVIIYEFCRMQAAMGVLSCEVGNNLG